MTRLFADISSWNPDFDAAAYRRAGHRLIAIKATEADTYINPRWEQWTIDAHRQRLVVAHYHFLHDQLDGAQQAEHFWHVVSHHHAAHDLYVVDVEIGDPRLALGHFTWRFRELSGHQLIGYTYTAFANQHPDLLRTIPGARWWIADYNPRLQLPRGLRRAWAWQRTDGTNGPTPHACSGIGRCDISSLNRASNTRIRLQTL